MINTPVKRTLVTGAKGFVDSALVTIYITGYCDAIETDLSGLAGI